MGYQIVGITVIIAWTSLITLTGFYILRKLHLLRVDKAIEEIGFDIAELGGGVSDEFLNVVREQIKAKKNLKLDSTAEDEEENDEEYIRKQLENK
jgi:hypothetical protein